MMQNIVMKKKVSYILALFLLLLLVIGIPTLCELLIQEDDKVIYWDGFVATEYHSGNGTINDPYIIETPSEFAYFAKMIEQGNNYENTYFKLIHANRIYCSCHAMMVGALFIVPVKVDVRCGIPRFGKEEFLVKIKEFIVVEGRDDTTKIRNSRCMGIVLTSECVFAIYNTGNALMKWEYRTEIRVNAFLQQYLSGNPYPGIPKVRAIMLGRNMDMAYRLLTSTGGHKKAFFSLDTSYEHFHYVPNTPEGELLLKVLCSPLLQKKLNQLLRSDLLPPDRQLAIEHDALTSEKDVVLFAYDFDMLRINKFNTALKLFGRRGVLIAFDFQLPVLKAFLGEDLQYSSIDLLKFKRGFLHGP